MTDKEKLTWCKLRANAEPWQHAIASIVSDTVKMGIDLNPGLYELAMGEAMIGGEQAVRRFIDELTLASIAKEVRRS